MGIYHIFLVMRPLFKLTWGFGTLGVSEFIDQEIENRDNKDESKHDDVECKSEWMKERLLERRSQIPNSIRGG